MRECDECGSTRAGTWFSTVSYVYGRHARGQWVRGLFARDVKTNQENTNMSRPGEITVVLGKLQDWSDKCLLEFNPSKGKVIKIGEGQRRPDTVYWLGKQRLQTFLKEKDFGVSTVLSISPEAHTNRITASANTKLAYLRVDLRNINKEVVTSL